MWIFERFVCQKSDTKTMYKKIPIILLFIVLAIKCEDIEDNSVTNENASKTLPKLIVILTTTTTDSLQGSSVEISTSTYQNVWRPPAQVASRTRTRRIQRTERNCSLLDFLVRILKPIIHL